MRQERCELVSQVHRPPFEGCEGRKAGGPALAGLRPFMSLRPVEGAGDHSRYPTPRTEPLTAFTRTRQVSVWPFDCLSHKAARRRRGAGGGDGGESNSPSRALRQGPLRACPMVCRRSPERPSAACRAIQSRFPRSGFAPAYVALGRRASPLDDASTTRGAEVASTLTLPPKRRGREQAGGCQLLRLPPV